jgi:hypothetical protein
LRTLMSQVSERLVAQKARRPKRTGAVGKVLA